MDSLDGASDHKARSKRAPKDTLFVTDEEMYKRFGVPVAHARRVVAHLDANKLSGFPQKSRLWGDRRYWPAVVQYLNETLIVPHNFSRDFRSRR